MIFFIYNSIECDIKRWISVGILKVEINVAELQKRQHICPGKRRNQVKVEGNKIRYKILSAHTHSPDISRVNRKITVFRYEQSGADAIENNIKIIVQIDWYIDRKR